MNRHLPLVTSSMERLTHLIEKAEPILQVRTSSRSLITSGTRLYRLNLPIPYRTVRPTPTQEKTNGRTQNG